MTVRELRFHSPFLAVEREHAAVSTRIEDKTQYLSTIDAAKHVAHAANKECANKGPLWRITPVFQCAALMSIESTP